VGKKRPRLSLPKRVLFGVVTTAALLLVVEFGARVFIAPQDVVLNQAHNFYRDDAVLFWSMPPNMDVTSEDGVPYRSNSLGLRDSEVSDPKPRNEFRILSMGESTTWGQGVRVFETYNEVLQKKLNAAAQDRRFEVINAGVGAYSLFQSYLYFTYRGHELKPDMVLLYHERNDFLPAGVWDRRNFFFDVAWTDKERYDERRPYLWLLSALYHSRLYLWARNRSVESRYDPKKDPFRYSSTKVLFRADHRDRRLALDQIRLVCRDLGITLVIIHPMYDRWPRHRQNCLLERYTEQHRVPFIDLHELVDAKAHGEKFWLDGSHPSALGHRVYAQAIYDYLVKKGLVPLK